MKKFISMLLVLMLAFSLAACGSGNSAGSSGAEEGGEEDGQNPIMNYVGCYVCGRAQIVIGAEGLDGANAMVTWSSSAAEYSSWVISDAYFDSEKHVLEYNNGCRYDYVFEDENAEDPKVTEVYTDGHGTMTFTDDPLTLVWQDDKEDIAKDMVFEYAEVTSDFSADMANPWKDADSLAAAAEGAGLDGFEIPEGTEISLGTVQGESYRSMNGLAEVKFPIAAVDMTIRKGDKAAASQEGDVSGDYNEYAHSWETKVGDVTVQCFGNREGEATKSIWTSGDYAYAILAYGAGGDDDFGLSEEDLAALVGGIK